jgi:hypothetical protein
MSIRPYRTLYCSMLRSITVCVNPCTILSRASFPRSSPSKSLWQVVRVLCEGPDASQIQGLSRKISSVLILLILILPPSSSSAVDWSSFTPDSQFFKGHYKMPIDWISWITEQDTRCRSAGKASDWVVSTGFGAGGKALGADTWTFEPPVPCPTTLGCLGSAAR